MQSFSKRPWFAYILALCRWGEGIPPAKAAPIEKSPNPVILKEINRNEDRNAMGIQNVTEKIPWKVPPGGEPAGRRWFRSLKAGTGCLAVERVIQGLSASCPE